MPDSSLAGSPPGAYDVRFFIAVQAGVVFSFDSVLALSVMVARLRSFKSMRDGSNTLHSIHRCRQTVALSDFMGVCSAF